MRPGLRFAALLLLGACSSEVTESGGPAARVRNAVVFTVDTLRADQLGAYGRRPSHTPHMDALGATGRLFERAYSPATLTNPSLTSLWTGLLPYQHGVKEQNAGFAKGIVTVPALVAEHGLATGCFLANMCKLKDIPGTVYHDGWQERFCGMLDAPEAYSEQYLWDEAVVTACADWIESRGTAPFLAWAHLMDPHAEHRPAPKHWDWERQAPEEKLAQYAYYNRFEELRSMPAAEVKERLLELYAAEVAGADDQLGRLLDTLDRLGLRDDTALIFAADHGEELFETWVRYDHGLSMTEGVFQVPLILSGPGIPAGRVADPVELSQVGATLLDLLGLDPLDEFAAGSLLADQPSRGYALSYAGHYAVSIRTRQFRYWLRQTEQAPTRRESPWRLEAPWFQEPELLATYEQPGSLLPTYQDLRGPLRREANKLRRGIEQTHAKLKRFGSAVQINNTEHLRALKGLGYLEQYEITGAPPADSPGTDASEARVATGGSEVDDG
jgi:arylsulfatase A-like enzyme